MVKSLKSKSLALNSKTFAQTSSKSTPQSWAKSSTRQGSNQMKLMMWSSLDKYQQCPRSDRPSKISLEAKSSKEILGKTDKKVLSRVPPSMLPFWPSRRVFGSNPPSTTPRKSNEIYRLRGNNTSNDDFK